MNQFIYYNAVSIIVILCALQEVKCGFYGSRVKPGKFEYPKHNGWMLPQEAVQICEDDLSCGGFTFRGAFAADFQSVEVYFFHIIKNPDVNEDNFYHWSTYQVDSRKYVILPKSKMAAKAHFTVSFWDNFPKKTIEILDKIEEFLSKDLIAVSIIQKEPISLSKIDFIDIQESEDPNDYILIKLDPLLAHLISHSLPKIDRCCKLNGEKVTYDGIDSFKRISCNIAEEDFTKEYINTRTAVMLEGCQEDWKAKEWTIDGLLDRYDMDTTWTTRYYLPGAERDNVLITNKDGIRDLIKENASFKTFDKIFKDEKGYVSKEKEKRMKLDLVDEYQRPKCMPKDLFEKFYISSDQCYLMLSTADTGTHMHMDPHSTDAYNGLIRGKKWWVYLPKDFLEYKNEYTCDPDCSDKPINHETRTGVWNMHILPQLRKRVFYGQTVQSGLQSTGETLFIPHFVYHSVYNVENNTVAIGDNFLYTSSYEELIATEKDWLVQRVIHDSKGLTKKRIEAVQEQMKKFTPKGKKIVKKSADEY